MSIELFQGRLYTVQMTVALITGMIGSAVTFIVGVYCFHLSVFDISLSLISSNVAAILSLFITLRSDCFPPPFKGWVTGTPKAWALLISLYFTLLLGMSPPLRDLETILYLSFPLVLSAGFAIIAFGPIRDKMIRNQQKKSLIRASETTEPKDDFPCFPTDSAVL